MISLTCSGVRLARIGGRSRVGHIRQPPSSSSRLVPGPGSLSANRAFANALGSPDTATGRSGRSPVSTRRFTSARPAITDPSASSPAIPSAVIAARSTLRSAGAFARPGPTGAPISTPNIRRATGTATLPSRAFLRPERNGPRSAVWTTSVFDLPSNALTCWPYSSFVTAHRMWSRSSTGPRSISRLTFGPGSSPTLPPDGWPMSVRRSARAPRPARTPAAARLPAARMSPTATAADSRPGTASGAGACAATGAVTSASAAPMRDPVRMEQNYGGASAEGSPRAASPHRDTADTERRVAACVQAPSTWATMSPTASTRTCSPASAIAVCALVARNVITDRESSERSARPSARATPPAPPWRGDTEKRRSPS